MPNQSIVFSPELDERQLSKETKKVNKNLNESTQDIKPGFDSSGMDSLRPAGAGAGGGRGGGMGSGVAGGALASKIPKPIAGVSVASALPVALGGAIGVGMLKAMHGASARLQTSTSILGSAWNDVWRPIGNKVDQLFIRDAVLDLKSVTQGFGDTLRDSSWLVDPMLRGIKNIMTGNAAGFVVNMGELALNIEEQVEWPTVPPSEVIGGIGWPEVAQSGLVGAIGWPAVGAGLVLDQMEWPTLTFDGVMDYLTDPSKGSGDDGGGGVDLIGGVGSVTRNREGDPLSGTGGGDPSGGGITRSDPGPNRGVNSPDRRTAEEIRGGMEGVKREIQKLNSQMMNMGVEMDGEKVGRMTDDAQRNRISGNDPTVL